MNLQRIGAFIASAAFVATIAAAPRSAKTPHKPKESVAVGGWTLETEQLDADTQNGDFSSPVKVHLTRGDGSTIDADRANGNYKRHQANLFGHVEIHDVSGTFGMKSAQNAPHQPATLATDELRVDGTTRVYDAQGNVHYEQGESTAEADHARLNDVTHRLDMVGKVHVVQGDRTLFADRATYDTVSGHGLAEGNVRMEFPGVTPVIATPKPITIKKIP
ncbi:MAG: LPS export ABC transporter periplasmic protein LptC [Candidatus Eremiobacteraeota bacterium]|nr:LPS export ABC transporter periplasmic protein LptC [Candidatus Eremiobacteraeota bacterium]